MEVLEMSKLTQLGEFLKGYWRPVLMGIFCLIVFNNYLFLPYFNTVFNSNIIITLPSQMWDLLKICVGLYVAGRSTEKIMETRERTTQARLGVCATGTNTKS